MKQYFVYKLIPPRPTFATDPSDAEAAIMAEHSIYWQGLLAQGLVVVFGLVLDPAGGWGLAVVECETAQEVHRLGAGDPAVRSGVASFEVYRMPRAFLRG